jgi:hypothetical protein
MARGTEKKGHHGEFGRGNQSRSGGRIGSARKRGYFLAFVAGGFISCLGFLLVDGYLRKPPATLAAPLVSSKSSDIRSLEQLLVLPPVELEKVDIGLMNLLSAGGLRGAENLDVAACLSRLDDWTQRVQKGTAARLTAFHQNPGKYDNSEAIFRTVDLVLALKNDLGVHYNLEATKHWDFSDSRDLFIHGLLDDRRAGTCTSIPVLCAAVGRRLGYPLKIVLAEGHVFLRWDSPKERFNIETTCPGVDVHDDEYYKKRPAPIDAGEMHRKHLLRSLTAAEELALFMATRSSSLTDTGRLTEAAIANAYACHLMPGHPPFLLHTLNITDHQLNMLAAEESRATGLPADYAIPGSFSQEGRYFVWRQSHGRPEPPAGPARPAQAARKQTLDSSVVEPVVPRLGDTGTSAIGYHNNLSPN